MWEREAVPTGTQTAPPGNTGSIALGKVRGIPSRGERQLSASNHTATCASGLCVKPQKEKPRDFSWPKCAVLVGGSAVVTPGFGAPVPQLVQSVTLSHSEPQLLYL